MRLVTSRQHCNKRAVLSKMPSNHPCIECESALSAEAQPQPVELIGIARNNLPCNVVHNGVYGC